jgi:uridine kinase
MSLDIEQSKIEKPEHPYLIGIAGGSGSGKTSVANEIFKNIQTNCLLFSMDTYYKDLSPDQMKNISEYNFDEPKALDLDLLYSHLNDLMNWKSIEMPTYDFTTSSRQPETKKLIPCKFIIFEGILSFYDIRIRNLMNMKIFVDLDDDIRLARRIYRDMTDRGRKMHDIISRYHKFVKPAYDNFIKPTRKYADIIIPRGAENTNAIDLISQNLKSVLKKLFPFDLDKYNFDIDNSQNAISHPLIHKKSVDEFIRNLNNFDIFNSDYCIDHNWDVLKKILSYYLEMKNSVYYDLYMDIIMKNVVYLFKCEDVNLNCNFIIYPSCNKIDLVKDNFSKKNSNGNQVNFVFIFQPIFLNENENIINIVKYLNEIENIKKITIICIFLTEKIVNDIKKLSNKVIFKSIYFGIKLEIYSYYIEKGGIFGKDSEGENMIFSENSFETYLTKKLLNGE